MISVILWVRYICDVFSTNKNQWSASFYNMQGQGWVNIISKTQDNNYNRENNVKIMWNIDLKTHISNS